MEKRLQEEFISILKEELVPAFGCTEPIALAYAAARGREVLGCEPERIVAKCSGNMIKNVRCVTIRRHDGNRDGLRAGGSGRGPRRRHGGVGKGGRCGAGQSPEASGRRAL